MKTKSLPLICFAIYNILLIYFLASNVYSLPMLSFVKNSTTYAISSLVLTIPSMIYGLNILKKGLSNLIHKKMSINLIISLEIIISYIYSIINVILIYKGHSELTNNLYFIPLSVLIYFTRLSNNLINNSFDIVDKRSNNYIFLMLIVSLIILVCYLELGYSFNKSINTFLVLLSASCPLALSLNYGITLNQSQKKCHNNNLEVDYQTIYEANKAEEIVIKKKKEAKYSIDHLNNYSKYSDEELLNIAASIENSINNKYSVAFNAIKSDIVVKNPREIPEIGISGKIKRTIISIGNTKLLEKKAIKNKYEKSITRLLNSNCEILYIIEKKDIIGIIAIKEIIPTDNRIISELKKFNKKVIFLEKEREIDEYVMRSKEKNINVLAYKKEDTSTLSLLFKISKKSQKIITENLIISVLLNIFQVIIILGIINKISINPLLPIALSIINSLLIILNSLRLKNSIKWVKIWKDIKK